MSRSKKKKQVILVLTPEEANALWNVVAYGWGDGEYAQLIEKQDRVLVRRAMKKFARAMQ